MTVNVLEWALSASALIVVVMLLRGVLGKRISAGLRYGLWVVVLVRLLVPVSFLSLPAAVPQIPAWTPPEAIQEASIYVLPVDVRPVENSGVHVFEDGTLGDPNSFGYPKLSSDGETVVRYADKISLIELMGWAWVAGSIIFAVVLLTANLRFSARLRRVRHPLEGTGAPVPVYAASALPSPCLMGLLFPSVYVTEEAAADATMLRHVLAHELTHYNHRDHLWSVLRGAALAVHWWNPLVWLAAVCSRRDGELACDEGALKRLGDGERAAYGETLLTLITAKSRPADLLSFATTMTGGKRSLKERIQRIAKQPKTLVSAMAAVIVVASLSVLVAFGQAKEAPDKVDMVDTPDSDPLPVETQSPDAGAWRSPDIVLTVDGVIELGYDIPGGGVEILRSNPVPAPREWADQDYLAGRSEATALQYCPVIWAELVSPLDGWLVACYGRGVAAADTYVYKTEDGGMNWTEVTMPGTSWHIADVGFLSPERLIVAQRLFDGAPCFITKDGGETWEEIELPDVQVLSIGTIADTIYMDIGAHESEPATFTMTSSDMGDNWTISSPAELRRFIQADLDHDGLPDTLRLGKAEESGLTLWKLAFTASYMSSPTWEGEASAPHAGWTAFFLCRMEGEDYLLQYTPYMGGGSCYYSYKLFYLTASGEEVVVQENTVDFDLIFDPSFADIHQYDPAAINAFMEEINTLLANSKLLVNTDENLIGTFQREGRLYDSVWWLDDDRDDSLTLLENLQNYGSNAEVPPDDTWSPLSDLPEEAASASYTAPELDESVRSEKASPDSQAEQYYEAGSLPLFQIAFSRLDKEAQGKWLEKIYADGDIAFFSVAVRGLGTKSSLVADLAEKVYVDENIAFFSTLADCMDEAELELWLARALEDRKWTFQSVLFNKLDRNDEFGSLKEENEKKWEEAQTAEYQAAGVTWEGKSCYYQGQLVNIFLDVRANKSFYTLDMNPAGTVNIKIIRNERNEITGVDYMTDTEVEDLLNDMG